MNNPVIHEITIGDTGAALTCVLVAANGDPVSLSGKTAKFTLMGTDGTLLLDEVTTGVSQEPTVTFTATANSAVFTSNGHVLENGQQVELSNSGGGLPTGLSSGVRYWVKERTPNRFMLSLTPTGVSITPSTAGTGTHSFAVIGSVQYAWQSATPISAAGDLPAAWTVYDADGKPTTFPNDQDPNDPKLIVRVREGLQ